MSWGKTLADDTESLQELLTEPREDPPPSATVEAPCCGRECGADMVVDSRGVPGVGRNWLCDACRAELLRDPSNEWTKPRLFRAMGAPAAVVRKERVRELVEERRREATERDELFDSREALQVARSEVVDSGMPAGTEPPG